MQSKDQAPVKVIDTSHWDTVTSWQEVKNDGVEAVYAKATDGTDWVDPVFINSVRGAQSVGLPIGAYHFLQPYTDARQQAKFFRQMLDTLQLDLIPVLDAEKAGITVQDVLNFADELGHPIIVYSYTEFIRENFPSGLSKFPLWIADYRNIDNPPDVGGWTNFVGWQFTETGSVKGVSTNVDISAFTSLNDIAYQPVDMKRTTTSNLNVRTGAGVQYALAEHFIPENTEIHLDKLYGNWAHTTYGPIGGWVNRHYLIETESEKNEVKPTINQ